MGIRSIHKTSPSAETSGTRYARPLIGAIQTANVGASGKKDFREAYDTRGELHIGKEMHSVSLAN